MNREEYLKLHKAMCDEMVEITRKKNMDYSTSDDPFANFRVIGAYGFDIEQGFLTRMSDKMSRLSNFTKNKTFAVSDESFRDTCLDLANYALLLAAYHTANSPKPVEHTPYPDAPIHLGPEPKGTTTIIEGPGSDFPRYMGIRRMLERGEPVIAEDVEWYLQNNSKFTRRFM